ncbi:MAG: hypothetical protein U0531_03125 [Dehalococcoidia bacterium]
MRGDIEPLLARVTKAARYTGGEWNSVVKDWDATPVRVLLTYPDVYDIGQSNLGLNILYDLLNRQEDVLCERALCTVAGHGSGDARHRYAVVELKTAGRQARVRRGGASPSYEMTYTNVLNMLDLAGVPVLADERQDGDPLVIAGGSGAL